MLTSRTDAEEDLHECFDDRVCRSCPLGWGAERRTKRPAAPRKGPGIYDLAPPKTTGHEGENDCSTFEAKAGMTVRTYDGCWKGGKIVEVVDKGMR